MRRPILRHLRRCRVLFALALCAWLGLATAVFAQADCCAGMRMGGMTTMTHHHDASAPMHAHADCACAPMTATLPAFDASVAPLRFAATIWQAWRAVASDVAHAPPLRPPLA